MNLSKQISKAKCKLASKVYKYSNLLAFGINRECLYKEIQLLNMFISTLINNDTTKCECDIKGQYSFDLPDNQQGYIEFLCNNIGYLHINGESIKFTYDYYNNQLIYDLGETGLGFILETHISTSLWDNNTSIAFYNDDTSIFEEPLGFDSIEEFIISFNENNTGGFILELKDGYILVLNSEGQNIQLDNLHLLISDTDIVSTIEEVEVEVPITYTTDITFDECCNIIGEFEGISSIDGDISNEGEGPSPGPGGLNNIIIYFLENNKDCNLPETCLNETEINSILEKLGLDLLEKPKIINPDFDINDFDTNDFG
jgi:hypothetical protein